MEYNKRTMFNRSKRCELEEMLSATIPYVSYKAQLITNELMDDDAVKVLTAFQQYCKDGKKPDMKDDFLNEKLQKVIAIHSVAKKFITNIQNIMNNG